ncbi:SPBc2 prophage-derived glycosyltransferase SunS [Candidatus Brocadiaceae bacterium B188]|nr:tetratricopeptide repeat protein [Candidatus Brocadia sapporoensis]QQR67958.1 MAG: tetratricopeptide repeat protein [Candidatus Brocadia sp.]RZV58064.1 MAG: tetratricopeptide repeat protein [Candidatus Brocadia sp. BROELEC01]TWU52816.1 SPBc2 prophage-derived glycosyltransferase SunS [Candidatus Brocadiaceae bacterium B188]
MVYLNDQPELNNGRPSLSACMIVKNEEKFLAQCLTSIKDAVDEIIIVDTGSTDKTIEIAKSFHAKIYHHPWKNSFSDARNHSLSYAKCDWILQIDADETLDQEDIPLLHKLICRDSYNAIFVAIYSELPGGLSKHYYTRIFRRGKAYFEGIVHNQLIFEGASFQSEIRFYHYGYNLTEQEMKNKYKRTGDLLRRQLVGDPDNLFIMTNLIRNYRNEFNFNKVIELGEKGLKLSESQTDSNSKNQRQRIYIDLVYAFINTNQLDKAEKICTEAIKENHDSLDILFVMGEVSLRKEKFNDALIYFKKYLIIKDRENKEPAFNLFIVDAYYYEHKAYDNIGVCYEKLNLFDEAEAAYKKAISLNSEEPLYYSNLAQLYLAKKNVEKAEDITNSAISNGIANDSIYMLAGQIQSLLKKPYQAINTMRQLINKNDKSIPAHIFLINLLIQTNQLKEAEDAVKVIISSNPDHLGLKCLMERIKFKNGDKDSAIKFINNTLESNPLNGNVYHDLGNLCIEIEEYKIAIELLEKYLNVFPTDITTITNIATCYARLGKLEPALIGFKAALIFDPTNTYALQNLEVLNKRLKPRTG